MVFAKPSESPKLFSSSTKKYTSKCTMSVKVQRVWWKDLQQHHKRRHCWCVHQHRCTDEEKSPNRLFNITDVFKNERNQVGVSPGQNEHILNASLSSIIMKSITYTVNDYISVVISTREKYIEVTVLWKWWFPIGKSFSVWTCHACVLQSWYLLAAAMHLGSRGKGILQCWSLLPYCWWVAIWCTPTFTHTKQNCCGYISDIYVSFLAYLSGRPGEWCGLSRARLAGRRAVLRAVFPRWGAECCLSLQLPNDWYSTARHPRGSYTWAPGDPHAVVQGIRYSHLLRPQMWQKKNNLSGWK